jgi:hypothetical protein
MSRPTVRVPSHGDVSAAGAGDPFLPIEKRIPITAGDPNFVPAGDLIPAGKSLSVTLDIGPIAPVLPGSAVANYFVVNSLLKVLVLASPPPSLE